METGFVLPAKSTASSPDAVERKRRLAEAMMAQGMSAEPISHPLQGAAKIAQALIGGYGIRKADQAEADGRKAASDAFSAAISGGDFNTLAGAMGNEYMSEGQQRVLAALMQTEMQRRQPPDPMQALAIEKARLEIDAMKNPKRETVVVGNRLLDKNTGEVVFEPSLGQGGGPFEGTSVEAQSLNGLVAAGKITPEQAYEIGAGKTVTDPTTGAMLFLTPSGIAAQMPGAPPQIIQPLPNASQPPSDGGMSLMPGTPVPLDPQGAMPAPQPSQAPAMAAPGPDQAAVPPKLPGVVEIRPGNKAQFNEGQAKAAGFADRISKALPVIEQYSDESSLWNKAMTSVPFGMGNFAVSGDYQKLDQARRDFVNAVLRRESGAVISDEEFDNANKQYFPQPGDGPDVVEQKRRNRETVLQSMQRDAGASYKPVAPQAVDPELDNLLKKYGG